MILYLSELKRIWLSPFLAQASEVIFTQVETWGTHFVRASLPAAEQTSSTPGPRGVPAQPQTPLRLGQQPLGARPASLLKCMETVPTKMYGIRTVHIIPIHVSQQVSLH